MLKVDQQQKTYVFGIWTKIVEPKTSWTIQKSLSQLPTLRIVFWEIDWWDIWLYTNFETNNKFGSENGWLEDASRPFGFRPIFNLQHVSFRECESLFFLVQMFFCGFLGLLKGTI